MKRKLAIAISLAIGITLWGGPTRKIIDDGGSGPMKAEAISEKSLPNFTIYRPAALDSAATVSGPLPLIVFGNGACNDTSLPYERMLSDLASYGYLVVALGEMQDSIGDREILKSPTEDMIKAIDWAEAENGNPASSYFGKIDMEYVGLAGHSCGGAQVLANCGDPRVKTCIILNAGMGGMEMAGATPESLNDIHSTILYIVGGESDIAYHNALADYEKINHVPVALANHPIAGHGGTYHEQYGGTFSRLVRAWLGWQFKDRRGDLSIFLRNRLKDFPDITMKAKNFPELDGVILTEEVKQPMKRPEFDPTNPDVHDPVIAMENGRYYMFTTGWGISMLSSDDLHTWQREEPPLTPIPEWAKEPVPAYKGHTWAPDIIKVGDRWWLYYSCSTFGKNISVIGVASNATLNPKSPDYKWEDHGIVIKSEPGVTDWNAIDPNVVIDEGGNPWMTFGSFWDGIQLVALEKDMKTPKGKPVTIARRRSPESVAHLQPHANTNAIEAPFIIKKDGWYYLFVSYDYCCKGLDSNYKTAVGRSRSVQGPYLDRDGKDMAETGGTVIVAYSPEYSGVGHCSVYDFDGRWMFAAHGYDKKRNGASKLYLREIKWEDGWPILPE